jgi:hypothetical protein
VAVNVPDVFEVVSYCVTFTHIPVGVILYDVASLALSLIDHVPTRKVYAGFWSVENNIWVLFPGVTFVYDQFQAVAL